MARLGLSIDSSSDDSDHSCELSDDSSCDGGSAVLWNTAAMNAGTTTAVSASSGTCGNRRRFPSSGFDARPESRSRQTVVPPSPSSLPDFPRHSQQIVGSNYRSRVRHRLEEWQRNFPPETSDESNNHDDCESGTEGSGFERPRRLTNSPRSRNRHMKLCMALCALTLVCISQEDILVNNSKPETLADLRHQEVAFPLHHPAAEASRLELHRLRSGSGGLGGAEGGKLPKFYFDKTRESTSNNHVTSSSASDTVAATAAKVSKESSANGMPHHVRHQSVAFARAADPLPVFGQPPRLPEAQHTGAGKLQPNMVQFFMESDGDMGASKGDHHHYFPPRNKKTYSFSWTTWLASFALLAMIVETVLKEYRQCRMTSRGQFHLQQQSSQQRRRR